MFKNINVKDCYVLKKISPKELVGADKYDEKKDYYGFGKIEDEFTLCGL